MRFFFFTLWDLGTKISNFLVILATLEFRKALSTGSETKNESVSVSTIILPYSTFRVKLFTGTSKEKSLQSNCKLFLRYLLHQVRFRPNDQCRNFATSNSAVCVCTGQGARSILCVSGLHGDTKMISVPALTRGEPTFKKIQ